MKNHSEDSHYHEMRKRIMGLGETSIQKSYYPQLQIRIAELEKINKELESEIQHRKRSEERFRSITEDSLDWIWEIDEHHNFTYSNPRVKEILNIPPDEIYGIKVIDLIPKEMRWPLARKFLTYKKRGGSFKALRININYRNKQIILETNGTPIFDFQGNYRGYRGIARDVTQQQLMNEQMQKAQKVEVIGTMAGGIAHDFNNILFIILSCSELILYYCTPGGRIEYNIKKVLTAVKRAKDLVNQILAYSRRFDQERAPLKIQPIILETIKLLKETIPSTIEIKYNLDDNLGYINADTSQIQQVLMNICTNSSTAMAESGGVLSISLHEKYMALKELNQEPKLRPGPYAHLEISDTGVGIDPKHLKRIFDPYFTTNKFGKSAGMGLAVVQGIVESMNGQIKVVSQLGSGTTCHLYFPVIKANREEPIMSREKLPGGTEKILVVDDEVVLSEVTKQILENLGYHAVNKTNGLEALKLFRSQPDYFDLVITDQTMPKMTGVSMAKEMLNIRKDIPIILCTGFSPLANEEIASDLGIKAFMMKPFGQSKLAHTVRKVLDQKNSDN